MLVDAPTFAPFWRTSGKLVARKSLIWTGRRVIVQWPIMSRSIRRGFLLLLAVCSLAAQAQFFPDPEYERVLVPVFWFGGGANGAQWWSSLELMNTGPAFDLGVAALQNAPNCPTFCGCDGKKTAEPFKSEHLCQQYEDPTGLLLYIPRNVNRSDVYLNLRVYDRSREALRAGTQIPVVWERDLLAGPIWLLDVKTEARYRTTLRIYDAFQADTPFTVRFYDMETLRAGTRELLLETTMTTHTRVTPVPEGRFPERPGYAVVASLAATYPQLTSAGAVAIEIIPHSNLLPPFPEKRFYALASITNNTTQEVTTVFP